MNSILLIILFAFLYLYFGRSVAICRYRFAHSRAAISTEWINTWQAVCFYPVTRSLRFSMEHAYKKVFGPLVDILPSVFYSKPSNYVLWMMFWWAIPSILTIMAWILVGILVLVIKVAQGVRKIYRPLHLSISKAIHLTLPKDILEIEKQHENKVRVADERDPV